MGLHKSIGGSVGHDIWRFKIPALAQEDASEPQGICLTGNYAFWDRYQFVVGFRLNKDTGGDYVIETEGKMARHAFPEGQLTNRLLVKTKHMYWSSGYPGTYVGIAVK